MTPDVAGIEAALAAGLAAHEIVWQNDGGDYGGRSWFECTCDADNVLDATEYATEAAHRAHLAAALLPVVTQAQADALQEFVQWVATHRAYNGAPDPGQSLYNECLNGVLPTWAEEWLRARADESGAR